MPDNDNNNRQGLPVKKTRRIEPLEEDTSLAADVIRQKIAKLYAQEPTVEEEQEITEHKPAQKRSEHQQYMHELSESGRSLAEIQTAWHTYYQELPDHKKHEVWDEFYREHGSQTFQQPTLPPTQSDSASNNKQGRVSQADETLQPQTQEPYQDDRSIVEVKKSLIEKIAGESKKKQANAKSMLFGLGFGGVVLLFGVFGFFNERFIAPFITPSTVLSSTPLIVDENTPVGDEAKIIIPKINLEIPVVYGEESIAENDVQEALEEGVLHYPITPEPGEVGNSVFFGHSSNNILNRGNYKFAFVLLNQLEPGDIFMLEKDGTRYVYRVFDKEVVPPTDFGVLDSHPDKESIATLITCDPPGTSINRLAVYGEQISPDPSDNQESSTKPQEVDQRPSELPSDAPTLWQRLRGQD